MENADNCKCEERTIVRHGAHNKDFMDKLYKCFLNLHENYAGFVNKENYFYTVELDKCIYLLYYELHGYYSLVRQLSNPPVQ